MPEEERVAVAARFLANVVLQCSPVKSPVNAAAGKYLGVMARKRVEKVGNIIKAPDNLKAFANTKKVSGKTFVNGGKLRPRWKDEKGNLFEWDFQHGKVEKYNKRGIHLGEFDPNTGVQTKNANPSGRIEP